MDFDLRKLHPLCCNFGMGNLGMFYGRHQGLGNTPAERDARLDRFLAATLAFGHTGFLVMEGGMPERRAELLRPPAGPRPIRPGRGRATSATPTSRASCWTPARRWPRAPFGGRRSPPRTAGGMKVLVNGHPTETWKTPEAVLPPNGWWAKDTKRGDLVAYSAMVDGHRADYVDSPAYVYADGRGQFTRFPKAACDGQLVALQAARRLVGGDSRGQGHVVRRLARRPRGDGHGAGRGGRQIGPAETRLARGLVYVTPVPKALSYVVKPGHGAGGRA